MIPAGGLRALVRRSLPVGASLLAGLVILGCRPSGSTPTFEREVPASVRATALASGTLDEAARRDALYVLNEPPAVRRAEQRLQAVCMRQLGFRPTRSLVGPTPRFEISGASPFTTSEARAHGFALRIKDAATMRTLDHEVGGARERALFGDDRHSVTVGGLSTPAEGCVAESRERLYRSLQSYLEVQEYRNRLVDPLHAWAGSPAVMAASSEYLKCMASSGFPADDYDWAVDVAQARFAAKGIQAGERALAVAHATCQAAVHLWDIADSEAAGSLAEWLRMGGRRNELRRFATMLHAVEARAQRLSSGAITSAV